MNLENELDERTKMHALGKSKPSLLEHKLSKQLKMKMNMNPVGEWLLMQPGREQSESQMRKKSTNVD